jgi:hypothetical protein
MTVGEEVGGEGVGASGLDPSLVTGTTLLNLDSEEDGTLTVGSASITDASILVEKPREPCEAGAVTLSVSVSGGLGGHFRHRHRARPRQRDQGGRARAPGALAVAPFRLVALDGGKSWNAIPRDATAICSLPPEREAAFRAAIETAAATIRDAYAKTDAGIAITVTTSRDAANAWTDDATADLLDLVAVVPSGPLVMSPDFRGPVETSTSVGEAVTEGTQLSCTASRAHRTTPRLRRSSQRWTPRPASPGARSRWTWQIPDGDRTSTRPPSPPRAGSTSASSARPGRHRGPCLARDRGHRRQDPGARHGLLRAADRSAALTRRAREHPDGGTLLAPARGRRRRTVGRVRDHPLHGYRG